MSATQRPLTHGPTRYGRQPAYAFMHEYAASQERSIRWIAQHHGVTYHRLHNALVGRARPALDVRELLVELLDRPLGELFTPEALRPQYVTRTAAPSEQEEKE